MNIDIRDIDSEFESYLRDIIDDHDFAAASKAVRFVVTNYKRLENEKENLKRKLLKEEEKNRKLASFKSKAFEFMALFKEENDGKNSSGN